MSREIVVVYAVLGLVVILFVRVPIGPSAIDGGVAPATADAPRCLALAYAREARRQNLPTAVRLRSTPYDLRRQVFEADGRPRFGGHEFAMWRPAGPDSIDIMWHHSPVIRVPTPRSDSSARTVGRLTSTGGASLVTRAMFPDVEVTAWSTPCSQFDSVGGP